MSFAPDELTNRSQCVRSSILSDIIVEDIQYFFLAIESSTIEVKPHLAVTNISIVDTTSKYTELIAFSL